VNHTSDRREAEARFRDVFAHLAAVAAYARRRGSRDADAVAAEVMTIAWRRLADVPTDDPRPWLYATARNLVLADTRRAPVVAAGDVGADLAAPQAPDLLELDPVLRAALRSLSTLDREALFLVAWEDLTPTQAARSLGINPVAFRVRLLRARRRMRTKLEEAVGEEAGAPSNLDLETT
jgi:RNA polymerase sigma-70 factor (ECF subfamily)